MPALLAVCGRLLTRAGIRHHLDADEGVIRLVFVTRAYRNPRGERFAIVTLTPSDDGNACHASIKRAFAAGADPAATCLTACRLARTANGIEVTYDEAADAMSIGVSTVLEGARPTPRQLMAMIDRLVTTAEEWHDTFANAFRRRTRREPHVSARRAM